MCKIRVHLSPLCEEWAIFACVSSAGESRCSDSLQMFGVFSKKVSQVGHCQHGGLRVLHGCAGVTRTREAFISPYNWDLWVLNTYFTALCGSHLFSAVLSIACILSSMVDLIRNLWTNVGLVDGKRVRGTHETVWNFSWSVMLMQVQ